jgi:ABC-type uncharacterized transport system ATPase subunit
MSNTSHEVASGPYHSGGAAPSALSAHSVSKRFPGVLANDSVDFDIQPGEVHTLLGENGAGKSTLAAMLCGLYQPDSGYIARSSVVAARRSAARHCNGASTLPLS